MEYLTLHELATQFNKPERQIRYRFRELLKENKLVEGGDFRKDDFVDEFHFAYKINPVRFMEEAKLVLDQQVVTNIVSKTDHVDSNLGTNEEEIGSNEIDHPESIGSKDNDSGYQSGSQPSEPGSNFDSKPTSPVTKFGTNQEHGADNTLSLDYIETLKEQLRVKDGQIESYKSQLDAQADLNRRSIGELLKMKDQVLRLTGASTEARVESQP